MSPKRLPDPYYTVRPLTNFSWEVTKWSPYEKLDLQTYTVAEASWATCTCPSFKKPCKHQQMVNALKGQEPEMLVKFAIDESMTIYQLEGL